ncbi:MAG TPA: MEDS domain-containing protein [Methanomassiliicoccales archaeon]|nr:MEDS domain-containing protein [Methanomassiliicoccales archaeon]
MTASLGNAPLRTHFRTASGAESRDSGIDVIGKVAWGTHFCQFYEDSKDLTDVLVPYFVAGLRQNEFCMWVTSEPFNKKAARASLLKALPDLTEFERKGQIEILDYKEWYVRSGKFRSEEVLNGWVTKLSNALAKGFDGLRLTGNTHWLETSTWRSFEEYEAAVNSVIGKYRMIALCSYSLKKCNSREILDVVANHQFALVNRRGSWCLIEGSGDARTREALRDSEERYRHLVQYAPTGIYEIDFRGPSIKSINEAATVLTGYAHDELMAMNPFDLLDEESKLRFRERIGKSLAGEKVDESVEFKVVRKDRSTIDVILNTKSVFEEGRAVGALVVGHDITERKRREESLNDERSKLYEVFDSLPAMLCLLTPDYHIAYANKPFKDKFGESNGRHCYEYCFGFSEPCKFCESYRVLETGQPHHWHCAHNGSAIDAYDVPFTDADGSPMILELDLDVSERVKAEHELKRSNAELQQFAYVASHDLQEPLRMIIGYLSLLNKKYRDSLDPNAAEYVDIAVSGGERMRRLIEDLLEYSRVGTQSQPFALVDMNGTVEKVLSNLQATLKVNHVNVEHERLPIITADSGQMVQVMQNLIGNAAKFHGTDAPQIRVSCQQADNEFIFSVQDNGIGVSPKYKDTIFQMFQRLHSSDEYPGTGMGLAITKKIVERHGGRIWVESEEGKGATFFFTIPKTLPTISIP